jgi:hypothetical protein
VTPLQQQAPFLRTCGAAGGRALANRGSHGPMAGFCGGRLRLDEVRESGQDRLAVLGINEEFRLEPIFHPDWG